MRRKPKVENRRADALGADVNAANEKAATEVPLEAMDIPNAIMVMLKRSLENKIEKRRSC